MKKLFLLFFLLVACQFSKGQSAVKPDKEQLLDYYHTQQYTEAVKYLQSIYNEDTEVAKEITRLAYANLMAGNLTVAEKYYLKLYHRQPVSLSVIFSLANISVKRGNDSKAKAYYLEILKTDSTNFMAYKQLAGLNKNELNRDRITYLQKAIQLNPTDAEVAFDLCELYFKMNLFEKAKEVLEPALKADSNNFQLLKMKIPVSIADKNYVEAIKTGETLLSYGDSSSFVYKNLAKSYFLTLDYQNALKCFLAVKEKSDNNEGLLYNIGLSYRGIKDYKNAIPYFEKAIKEGVSAKIASYYNLMGDSYENINKNEAANAAYKKGLQFENDGSLLYNIALVYETKLNDKKNAINYYEQYLKTVNSAKQPRLTIFIKNKIKELKK